MSILRKSAAALAAFALAAGIAGGAERFGVIDAGPMGWQVFFGELLRSIDAVGFVMIVFFLILIGMCIDLFNSLRIGKMIPETLLSDVTQEMANGEYEKALDISQKSDSLTGSVFAAALGKSDYSFERMAEAMRSEVRIQGLAWQQWVGQFRTIAFVALLLGVGGFLIESMRFVADMTGRPNLELAIASSFELRALAYGAFFALFMGVIMAMLSLIVSMYGSAKLGKILLESERLGEELLDPFRPLPQGQEEGA